MQPTAVKFPEVKKRMIAARAAMVLDEPFFGALALRLTLVEDPGCGTAWVDGKHLGYDPAFITGLKMPEVIGLYKHEVMHCAAGHPWRRGQRDHKKFNEAADRAINPMLRDAGTTLPADALYELEPSHRGKSAEWIYDRLPQSPPASGGGGGGEGQPDGNQSQGQGQGKPQPKPGGQGQKGAGNGPGGPPKQGNGPARPDMSSGPRSPSTGQTEGNAGVCPKDTPSLGEVRDAPNDDDPNDPTPSEEDWRQATQQAAAIAKGQGKLPGAMKRFARETAKPMVDWRSATRRFVQEVAKSDYSMARPNPRYVAHSMIMPSLRSYQVGEIGVGIDVSGSVDDVLLGQFQAEVRAIVDEVKPRRIHVFYCDARIQRTVVFEPEDEIKLEACGGGGTDFRPVFDAIEQLDEPLVCLVYLTDLLGTFPSQAPAVPTLWVTGTRDERPVPFGEVVAAS